MADRQKPLWRDPRTVDGAPLPPAPWRPSDPPRFVQCNLSDLQKDALSIWAAEQLDGDMVQWLESAVLAGHTVSVRANEFGFQASVTGVKEGTAHYGQSLIARASTPVKALQACWYRDVVVLEGTWPVGKTYEQLDF